MKTLICAVLSLFTFLPLAEEAFAVSVYNCKSIQPAADVGEICSSDGSCCWTAAYSCPNDTTVFCATCHIAPTDTYVGIECSAYPSN